MGAAEIYIVMALWLFAIVFTVRGTLSLWSGLVDAKFVSWAVLPGTLVAELAHSLACMVTGAEFRGRKLVGAEEGKSAGKAAASQGGVKFLTPLLTGLLPPAACFALIYLFTRQLGHPVYEWFQSNSDGASQTLPTSAEAFWTILTGQVRLLHDAGRSIVQTLDNWPWNNWKGWLLEYLILCLTLRMAPAGRPLRPTLAGVAVLALLTSALVAILSKEAAWLKSDFWPLLSFTWATALMLLAFTLCVRGVVGLVKVLAGKE